MLTQRFWSKVDKTTTCWNWTAFCPECGDDLMYETDCGISCVCGFKTLDETEVELFA